MPAILNLPASFDDDLLRFKEETDRFQQARSRRRNTVRSEFPAASTNSVRPIRTCCGLAVPRGPSCRISCAVGGRFAAVRERCAARDHAAGHPSPPRAVGRSASGFDRTARRWRVDSGRRRQHGAKHHRLLRRRCVRRRGVRYLALRGGSDRIPAARSAVLSASAQVQNRLLRLLSRLRRGHRE